MLAATLLLLLAAPIVAKGTQAEALPLLKSEMEEEDCLLVVFHGLGGSAAQDLVDETAEEPRIGLQVA